MSTPAPEVTEPGPIRRPAPRPAQRYLLWPARNLWRSLTSMRTALALLFLLAVAAIPGAMLPQRNLNAQKTAQYIADNGTVGEVLDTLQMFEVFSSVWFTAIYALLFISLVGCLTPRIGEHAKIFARAAGARTPQPRAVATARGPRYRRHTGAGRGPDRGPVAGMAHHRADHAKNRATQ